MSHDFIYYFSLTINRSVSSISEALLIWGASIACMSLLAELKQNRDYELRVGNEKVIKPNYDLEYFKEKIPQNAPVLIPGKIISIEIKPESKTSINRFFQSKLLIWAAILVVITLLGFMTWQMFRESGTPKSWLLPFDVVEDLFFELLQRQTGRIVWFK